MADDRAHVTLYYAAPSRAFGTLVLLEELGAPYELEVLNLAAEDQRRAEYLAINPVGKVPAIVHDGAVVTEQVAIAIYLCDAFPKNGLAPSIGNSKRGPYLRWLVYYAAAMEPACVDKALGREPGRRGMMPYGDYDTTLATVARQLEQGPYILGDTFSGADVIWGVALDWLTRFGLVPHSLQIDAYVARVLERPAVARARTIDARLQQPKSREFSASDGTASRRDESS